MAKPVRTIPNAQTVGAGHLFFPFSQDLLRRGAPLPTKTLALVGMVHRIRTLTKAAAAVDPAGPADAPEVLAFLARLSALDAPQRKVAAHLLARMGHDRLLLAALDAGLAPLPVDHLVRAAAQAVPPNIREAEKHGWNRPVAQRGAALWRLATALGCERVACAAASSIEAIGLPPSALPWLGTIATTNPAFFAKGLFGRKTPTTGQHLDFPVYNFPDLTPEAFAAPMLAAWSALGAWRDPSVAALSPSLPSPHALIDHRHVLMAALAGWNPLVLGQRARMLANEAWSGAEDVAFMLARIANTSAHEGLAFAARIRQLDPALRAACVHATASLAQFGTLDTGMQRERFENHPALRAVFL